MSDDDPHTPVTRSPQVEPSEHCRPQSIVPPHPSPMAPQYWPPVGLQVSRGQDGPPLHEPSTQNQPLFGQVVPQSMLPPHALQMVPQ
jgi:hypothetical protein